MTTDEEPTLKDDSIRARHHRMMFWTMQALAHQAQAHRATQHAIELHQAILTLGGYEPTKEEIAAIQAEFTGQPATPKPRIVRP